jgi:hypothetical protein
VPRSLQPFLARLVQPRHDRRFRSAQQALSALDGRMPLQRATVRLAAASAAAFCSLLVAFARISAEPAPAPQPMRVPRPSAANVAQQWFARAKPSCNPVEVGQLMSRRPPPDGWEGAGYGAGCWALAGKIDEARALLGRVDRDQRWRAAGIVFDLAHPIADAGDDVDAAPIMNLVLESWPNNYMALYHAGMSDYALGHADRARTHLVEFLKLYATEDGFRHNAQQVLARLR